MVHAWPPLGAWRAQTPKQPAAAAPARFTIVPSSVDCERSFSIMKYLKSVCKRTAMRIAYTVYRPDGARAHDVQAHDVQVHDVGTWRSTLHGIRHSCNCTTQMPLYNTAATEQHKLLQPARGHGHAQGSARVLQGSLPADTHMPALKLPPVAHAHMPQPPGRRLAAHAMACRSHAALG